MRTEQTSVNKDKESITQGIDVVAKPIGPVCNLNCEYCFYQEKRALFAAGEQYRMPNHVLSAFITNYITCNFMATALTQDGEDLNLELLQIQRRHTPIFFYRSEDKEVSRT